MKTAEQIIVEALNPALRNGLAENRAAIIVMRLENYMRGDGPKFQFKEPEQYASDDDIAALARGW